MQNYKARQTALLGMLFALSMALSFLESMLTPFFGLMPAMKLGLSNISFAVRGRAFSGCVLPASGIAIHHHRLHFFGQRGTGAQLRPAAGGCSAAFRQNGNHLCADAADSGSYRWFLHLYGIAPDLSRCQENYSAEEQSGKQNYILR